MIIKGTNMYMTRGDTENITVRLSRNGEPADFRDGDTIYFTVKYDVNMEEKLLQKVITEFDEGKATIYIAPEDTKDFFFGEYVYDIQYTDVDGNVKTIVRPSKFEIGGEVTYE